MRTKSDFMGKKSLRITHFPILIFLLLYIFFSILTYKHYGISYDEPDVYSQGKTYINFLINSKESSQIEQDVFFRNYSHIYAGILSILNNSESYEIYHLLNLLFAIPLYISIYLLIYKQYKNSLFAILGPIFVLMTPTVLGHTPINPKDIPFATLYISSLLLIFFIERNSSKKFLLLTGVIIGLAQITRLVGLSLHLIFLFYALYKYLAVSKPANIKRRKIIKTLVFQYSFIFLISIITSIASQPYLWQDTLKRSLEVIVNAKQYPWNAHVLFMGRFIEAFKLPIYYLPFMFLVTTPIFILFFFFSSLITVKNKMVNKLFMLLTITILINILLFLAIRPVVYDGVRHYLFLVSIISIFASISFIELLQRVKKHSLLVIPLLFATIMALPALHSLRHLHPYEYIYYNELVGGLKGAYNKFETDYWASSTKEAVEWLIQNRIEKNKKYKIHTCANPSQGQYYLKPNMLWTKDYLSADYYLCFTRWNVHTRVDQNAKIHTIDRDGIPLTIIYKLNN